jgi:hypothetical protein
MTAKPELTNDAPLEYSINLFLLQIQFCLAVYRCGDEESTC